MATQNVAAMTTQRRRKMLRRYDMFFMGCWETFVGSKSRIMHYAAMTTQNVAIMTTQNVAIMATQNVAAMTTQRRRKMLRRYAMFFMGFWETFVGSKSRIMHYATMTTQNVAEMTTQNVATMTTQRRRKMLQL